MTTIRLAFERPARKGFHGVEHEAAQRVVVRHFIQPVEKDDGPARSERRLERVRAFFKWGRLELPEDVLREVLAAVHGGKRRGQAGGELAQFDEDRDQVRFLFGPEFQMLQPVRVGLEAALDEAQAEEFQESGLSRTRQTDQDQPGIESEPHQRRHFVGRG